MKNLIPTFGLLIAMVLASASVKLYADADPVFVQALKSANLDQATLLSLKVNLSVLENAWARHVRVQLLREQLNETETNIRRFPAQTDLETRATDLQTDLAKAQEEEAKYQNRMGADNRAKILPILDYMDQAKESDKKLSTAEQREQQSYGRGLDVDEQLRNTSADYREYIAAVQKAQEARQSYLQMNDDYFSSNPEELKNYISTHQSQLELYFTKHIQDPRFNHLTLQDFRKDPNGMDQELLGYMRILADEVRMSEPIPAGWLKDKDVAGATSYEQAFQMKMQKAEDALKKKNPGVYAQKTAIDNARRTQAEMSTSLQKLAVERENARQKLFTDLRVANASRRTGGEIGAAAPGSYVSQSTPDDDDTPLTAVEKERLTRSMAAAGLRVDDDRLQLYLDGNSISARQLENYRNGLALVEQERTRLEQLKQEKKDTIKTNFTDEIDKKQKELANLPDAVVKFAKARIRDLQNADGLTDSQAQANERRIARLRRDIVAYEQDHSKRFNDAKVEKFKNDKLSELTDGIKTLQDGKALKEQEYDQKIADQQAVVDRAPALNHVTSDGQPVHIIAENLNAIDRLQPLISKKAEDEAKAQTTLKADQNRLKALKDKLDGFDPADISDDDLDDMYSDGPANPLQQARDKYNRRMKEEENYFAIGWDDSGSWDQKNPLASMSPSGSIESTIETFMKDKNEKARAAKQKEPFHAEDIKFIATLRQNGKSFLDDPDNKTKYADIRRAVALNDARSQQAPQLTAEDLKKSADFYDVRNWDKKKEMSDTIKELADHNHAKSDPNSPESPMVTFMRYRNYRAEVAHQPAPFSDDDIQYVQGVAANPEKAKTGADKTKYEQILNRVAAVDVGSRRSEIASYRGQVDVEEYLKLREEAVKKYTKQMEDLKHQADDLAAKVDKDNAELAKIQNDKAKAEQDLETAKRTVRDPRPALRAAADHAPVDRTSSAQLFHQNYSGERYGRYNPAPEPYSSQGSREQYSASIGTRPTAPDGTPVEDLLDVTSVRRIQ